VLHACTPSQVVYAAAQVMQLFNHMLEKATIRAKEMGDLADNISVGTALQVLHEAALSAAVQRSLGDVLL
jgi:hypothetical protein